MLIHKQIKSKMLLYRLLTEKLTDYLVLALLNYFFRRTLKIKSTLDWSSYTGLV